MRIAIGWTRTKKNDMKIIQIFVMPEKEYNSNAGEIMSEVLMFGLGDDGMPYIWLHNEKEWTLAT